jgi:sulfate/thiosulfate transport system substrate-binding protein
MKPLSIPALTLAMISLVVAGCGSSAGGAHHISLVAYSTPQEAYAKLIPAFQATTAGRGVAFTQSYGASGDQERSVASGLPADVVALSLAPDVKKLVDASLVSPSWSADQYRGFVTDSVVAFVVRKGNPKHIATWADLVKPGIGVVTPNPLSSGGARWNVMAAYGAQIKLGQSPAQALAYLKSLFKNVVAQGKSARDSLQTFTAGKGDVLLSYENEAITAQKKGQNVDYVIPPQTILIENPIAVTTKAGDATAARAFVAYLHTPAAQTIFVSQGYRSVLPGLTPAGKFPTPAGLFTIAAVGGWTTVSKKFFDPQSGIFAGIERGVSGG